MNIQKGNINHQLKTVWQRQDRERFECGILYQQVVGMALTMVKFKQLLQEVCDKLLCCAVLCCPNVR